MQIWAFEIVFFPDTSKFGIINGFDNGFDPTTNTIPRDFCSFECEIGIVCVLVANAPPDLRRSQKKTLKNKNMLRFGICDFETHRFAILFCDFFADFALRIAIFNFRFENANDRDFLGRYRFWCIVAYPK